MFSLDSNAMKSLEGQPLTHFTPSPSPLSAGVDAFSQAIDKHDNYYAFPPYCLLASVFRFIIDEQINCTLIPHFIPVPNWFTLVLRYAVCITIVGFKGQQRCAYVPVEKRVH